MPFAGPPIFFEKNIEISVIMCYNKYSYVHEVRKGIKMIKKLTRKSELAFQQGRLLLIIFCIYTLAVKFIGREPIGPNESKVGFAGLNKWFRDLVNYNSAWYSISKFFGILVILTAVMFGLLGLIELIRRKNLWSVDMNYISLGFFYVVVAIVYFFFEIVAVNYRPVMTGDVLEASYPSTHTMLAICVMGSAMLQSGRLIRDTNKRFIFNFAAFFIAFMTVLARAMSGVHWITDIIGGLLLSFGMVLMYKSTYIRIEAMKELEARKTYERLHADRRRRR